jgi:hypothetical protein
MRLDQAFGEKILALDSASLNNDTLFWAKFPGIQIKATNTGSVIGLDLNDRTFSRMTLYYRKDTANAPQRVFNVQFIGENKFVKYDRSPSSFITDRVSQVLSNDLMALQGLGGYKIEVEIPNIAGSSTQNWLVNTADLVLYSSDVPNDNPIFAPAKQLSMSLNQGDSTFVFLPDITYSLNATGSAFGLVGGVPVSLNEGGVPVKRYKLSVPSHLQDMILQKASNKFYLNLYPQSRSAERLIVHSPGAATSPLRARLNLRYTVID